MAYKEIKSELWIYEKENDFVEGILKKESLGSYGKPVYTLETDKGLKVVFGTTILVDKMSSVNIGDQIKITYLGTKPSQKGQNPTKIFKVEKDDEASENQSSGEDQE